MTGAPQQLRPFDGPAGAGLRREWSQVRAYAGLADPPGEVVDDVCLRTVLPLVRRGASHGVLTAAGTETCWGGTVRARVCACVLAFA